jgi:hypothetical protein
LKSIPFVFLKEWKLSKGKHLSQVAFNELLRVINILLKQGYTKPEQWPLKSQDLITYDEMKISVKTFL